MNRSGVGVFTYYDHMLARQRIKRRYVWAFWAFMAGSAFGFMALQYVTLLAA